MIKTFDKNNYILIGVGVIILILLIVLLSNPFKSQDEDAVAQLGANDLSSPPGANNTTVQMPAKTDNAQGTGKIVYSDSDLCEDHVMEQGESITVDKKKITLVKIGSNSARVDIAGSQQILPEGSSVYANGIRVEMLENDYVYFGEDDPDNSVQLRIGCEKGSDPSEKNILATINSRGESICSALIKQCKQQFDWEP